MTSSAAGRRAFAWHRPVSASIRYRVTAGLAAAVLVLLVGAVALWTTERTAVAARAVDHSQIVLDTLDHVLSRLRDAEARQRGYLLTGDTSYLGSFHTAESVIKRDIAALGRLTAGDSVQQQRIPALKALVASKLDELERTVALRADGNTADAIALVRTNEGKRTMDAINEMLGAMKAYERSLLAVRAERQRASVRAAVIIIAFGSVGAFMLAFAAHLLVRRAMEEQRRTGQEQHFLADASATLASSLDFETTLAKIAQLAVPVMADWCAVDLVRPDGSIQRVAIQHSDPAKVRLAEELQERYPNEGDAPYGVRHVIRTRDPELVRDLPESFVAESAQDEEHLAQLRSLGLTSYMVVPLVIRDDVLGALTFIAAESGRRYTPRDLELATDLAHRAAMAIDNARLFRDVEEARQHMEQQATELETQAEALEHAATEADAINEELQRVNRELSVRTEAAEMARARAVVANRAKSDFLAVMSHELRTPLQAIIGYTELLADGITGPVTEAQHEQLARVQASGRHLLALIDELLTFSRIDAGKEPVRIERLDVCALARETVVLIEPTAEAKGIGIMATVPHETCEMESDPTKVRQILLNLLSNAVKFTSDGEVTLTVRTDARRMAFEVRDTGIGIAPENLDRIFDPFWQVEHARAKRVSGTGLGLAVTRQLARLLGGDITVQSTPGRGSTFTVWLPVIAKPTSSSMRAYDPEREVPTERAQQSSD
ncbi:MAG TPA: CHASE3 domain-containing protein [Gemmatimonadaceae bacterium]|nr:CHASE3 domain-containing protein [Gemmatimonadaceae bacterium]